MKEIALEIACRLLANNNVNDIGFDEKMWYETLIDFARNDSTSARLFKKLIKVYGYKNQLNICSEECSELAKECSKWIRGKGNRQSILEEMVDVSIMIEQLKLIFKITESEFEEKVSEKINRTKERLESNKL